VLGGLKVAHTEVTQEHHEMEKANICMGL